MSNVAPIEFCKLLVGDEFLSGGTLFRKSDTSWAVAIETDRSFFFYPEDMVEPAARGEQRMGSR
jgi:hypothetical protein